MSNPIIDFASGIANSIVWIAKSWIFWAMVGFVILVAAIILIVIPGAQAILFWLGSTLARLFGVRS